MFLVEEAACLMALRRKRLGASREIWSLGSSKGKASRLKAYGRTGDTCEVGMVWGQDQNCRVFRARFGV